MAEKILVSTHSFVDGQLSDCPFLDGESLVARLDSRTETPAGSMQAFRWFQPENSNEAESQQIVGLCCLKLGMPADGCNLCRRNENHLRFGQHWVLSPVNAHCPFLLLEIYRAATAANLLVCTSTHDRVYSKHRHCKPYCDHGKAHGASGR
jgi:hypothetical protein